MRKNVFVGRQPIFDQKGNIYAYELLYRNSDHNSFPNVNPEKATVELLVNTFLTIGIDQVVNRTKSFINFSDKLIFDEAIEHLDTKVVVIELLEDIEVTPEVIARLRHLRKIGFMLVLDDFLIGKEHELYQQLYSLIDIIKVDFMFTPREDRKRIEALRKKHRHIKLLAEKIETKAEYEEALAADYMLFQGYYFAKPDIIKGKDIVSNSLLHMSVFQKLNEAVPDIDDISNLIKHDVALSYKLLRHINSFAFDIRNEISSIKQAIMMMGLNNARKWIQILLLYDLGDKQTKGRERALIASSLTRAKICEMLARENGKTNADEYFLTGMFSQINIIMYQSWDRILPQLSLSEPINDTVRGKETEISPYLQLAEAMEDFHLPVIEEKAKLLGITDVRLTEISVEAHRWAVKFM